MTPNDVAASIYHALGTDPQFEYYARTVRRVRLVPEGHVIQNLFL